MPFDESNREQMFELSKNNSKYSDVNYHFTGCSSVDPNAACNASPEITRIAPLNSYASSNKRMSCGKISIPAAVPAIDNPTAEMSRIHNWIEIKKKSIIFLLTLPTLVFEVMIQCNECGTGGEPNSQACGINEIVQELIHCHYLRSTLIFTQWMKLRLKFTSCTIHDACFHSPNQIAIQHLLMKN